MAVAQNMKRKENKLFTALMVILYIFMLYKDDENKDMMAFLFPIAMLLDAMIIAALVDGF
jgi:hypothetical protein